MAPGARITFGAPPCSKLRSFRSKCTVLKKVVTLWGLFEALHSHSVPPLLIRRPHSDSEPGQLFLLAPLVTPLASTGSVHFMFDFIFFNIWYVSFFSVFFSR